MQGGFGKGFDDGKKTVKWIIFIMIGGFVLWFLFMGFGLIEEFVGFGW